MTQLHMHETYAHNISTHILTKRMTHHRGAVSKSTEYFNSHPHEEDDTSY